MNWTKKLSEFFFRIHRWAVPAAIATYLCSQLFEIRLPDFDIFARVAVGRLIAIHGGPITADPFAFTPTKAVWIDHEWLASIALYWTAATFGDPGLFALTCFFIFATAAVVYRAQQKYFHSPLLGGAWMLCLLLPSLTIWFRMVRAQAWTFLFFGILLWVLVEVRRKPSTTWLLSVPLLMLVWLNCHGGFVIGLGFLSLLALLAQFDGSLPARRLTVCAIASTATIFVNPYGLRYAAFIIEALSMRRELIDEWKPVSLLPGRLIETGTVSIAVAALLLAAGAVCARRTGKATPIETLPFLIVALAGSLRAYRLLPFFCFTAAVYGLPYINALFRSIPLSPARRNDLRGVVLGLTMLACTFAVGIAGLIAHRVSNFALTYREFPVAAVQWLRENRTGGNVLVPFDSGSYVLWRAYPQFKVSIDGRYEEVYPDDTLHDSTIASNPAYSGHQEALQRIAPDFILTKRTLSGDFPGFDERMWRTVYSDSLYAILARADGTAAPAPPREGAIVDDELRTMWKPRF